MTGATGYLGSEIARKLRGRGDEVVALVRTPSKAEALGSQGCELIPGDLGDEAAIRAGMSTCEAAIHAAAVYEVGIPDSQRPAMYDANVGGTERVLQAAQDVGLPRVIYVSTQGALGDTKGRVVDENHEHGGRFSSYYEETKFLAHQVARRYIDEGVPCIIVMPGFTYGPDDPSPIGDMIDRFIAKKLPALPLATLGGSFAHRDDITNGIIAALDKGRAGETYILGGDKVRNSDFIRKLAETVDRKPPPNLPTFILKAMAPIAPVVGPAMGLPPNLRDVIAADGMTFWGSHEKATRELGYKPRSLDEGLEDVLAPFLRAKGDRSE